MSECSHILSSIDILGKNFNFYINGRYKYKTFLGGIFSFLICISVLGLIGYFGRDIYFRKSPTMLVKTMQLKTYPTYNVTQKNFNLAWRISSKGNQLIDVKSYFEYKFAYVSYKLDSDGSILSGTLEEQLGERCSEKHLPREVLERENLQNYVCVNNTYQFGGSLSTSFVSYPVFFVTACSNITEAKYGVKCKDATEVSEELQRNIFIDIVHQKNLVDPGILKEPIVQSYNRVSFQLNIRNQISKNIYLNYNTAVIETDTGIIFSDTSSETFLEYESRLIEEVPYSEDLLGWYYAKCAITLNKDIVKYSRHYINIPEILATVGGFMSVAMTVVEVIYFPFWDNDLWDFLQNKLYKFEVESFNNRIKELAVLKQNTFEFEAIDKEKDKEREREKEKDKENELTNHNSFIENKMNKSINTSSVDLKQEEQKTNSNSLVSPIFEKTNQQKSYSVLNNLSYEDKKVNLNIDINKLLMNKKKERTSLKISKCWRLIYTYIFCIVLHKSSSEESKLRYKLFMAANSEFLKKIEVFEMFKTFDQFSLLKKIILNENQNFMAKNRDRKTIVNISDIDDKDSFEEFVEKKKKKSMSNLNNYLQKALKLKEVSEIDKLLLLYLDPEIQNSLNVSEKSLLG